MAIRILISSTKKMVFFHIALLCLLIGYGEANPVRNYTKSLLNTSITTYQRTAELKIHETEYIECTISTNQETPTNVTWTRNGVKIKKYTITTSEDTHKLELKGSKSEVGTYACIMTDANGSITSKTKDLNPVLTITAADPSKGTVTIDKDNDDTTKSVTIQCTVISFPKANVTFKHGRNVVVENDRISIQSKTNGSQIIYELKINHISYNDVGEYFCEANNQLMTPQTIPVKKLALYVRCSNSTEGSYWKCPNVERCVSKLMCKSYEDCVKFNCELPNRVANVKIVHCTYDSVEIKWDKNEHSKSYSIEVARADSMLRYYESVSNDITLTNLNNNTLHKFTVHAVNNFGRCLEGVTLSCKTPRMVKPTKVNEPVLIKAENGFQIVWDPSKDDGMDNKAGALSYNVKVCKNSTYCQQKSTTKTALELNEIDMNVNSYRFEVTPVNAAGQPGETKSAILYLPSNTTNSSSKYEGSEVLHILCSIALIIHALRHKEWI